MSVDQRICEKKKLIVDCGNRPLCDQLFHFREGGKVAKAFDDGDLRLF